MRGEYDRLIESGRLFLELASAAGSKAAEASAYGILGHAHMYSGRFGMALEALEKCFELESSREHTEMTSAQNLTVTTLTCQTMVLWHLGFPDRVLDKCTEALDYARRLESPFDLAFALYHTALAVHPLGAYEKQREYILEALAIAQEHGFLWWSMLGRIVLGWVELEEEETSEQALDTLQVCLGSYVGFGARIGHTYQLAVIANGALRRRRQEQAAGALLEAFKSLLETSEHYAEPEVHRLNGEFLLTFDGAESCDPQHPGASAEDCFRRALEMAQRQGSKAWALRTATDLARLRQSQGRAEEALSVLKPLYEDYQEGFDTLDLVRARETLEALGR